MDIPAEFEVVIGVIFAILGVAGFLALRGWLLRIAVLIVGLLVAAYFLDLLDGFGLPALFLQSAECRPCSGTPR